MASYHFIVLLIASFWLALCPAMVLGAASSSSSRKAVTSTAIAATSPTQARTSSTASSPPVTSSLSSSSTFPTGTIPTNTTSSDLPALTPDYTQPDVLLKVPNLSVQRIELDVDNLSADINLNAKVANLVTINAGVALSVQKINITIADVEVKLELIVRLGHLVDIVQRVFQSLDLNPLLISALNDVTQVVDTVIVGVVDGLLGSLTKGGTTLNFIIDNLGNIVSNVVGSATNAVDQIVGNYQNNMTYTGQSQNLGNGMTQKTYSYAPLNALVDIVFDSAGQVVQATAQKSSNTGSATTLPTSSASASLSMSSISATITPATSSATASA